jgi:hypothetical protein
MDRFAPDADLVCFVVDGLAKNPFRHPGTDRILVIAKQVVRRSILTDDR